ncbi:HPr family phosphocarrier protein [Candidatus Woesearchaeota archaeon]|nr:HPr family phosphocarrier protein [Candidatus Woesearchaeota archaeon]
MKPKINKIRYEGRPYVSLDAVVNLHVGICMDSSSRIVKECENFAKQVYMSRNDHYRYTADCKRMLEVMTLGAGKGTEIKILVEGQDRKAKNLAFRLYNGVTSKNSYNMNFEGREYA